MVKYNRTICEFLKRNGVNLQKIPMELNKSLCAMGKETILSSFLYSVYDATEIETVTIKNLAGTIFIDSRYDSYRDIQLFTLLEFFFDKDGDEYHHRSVGLLEYSKEELLVKLNRSFDNDPIYLTAIGEKLYVTINGNHRAFVLLFHELNSKQKDTSIQVKARVSHLNLELSGMMFMMKQKYGSRFRKDTSDIKNGKIEFMLDGIPFCQNIEEFKNFVKKEFSKNHLTFHEFREFLTIALENSIRDIHFRNSMNSIFEGFSKCHLPALKKLLQYTLGIEQVLDSVPFEHDFNDYIKNLKETILKLKLEALKTSIKAKKEQDQKRISLEKQKEDIKKTLQELEEKEKEAQFYKQFLLYENVMSESSKSIDLETREKDLKEQIKSLEQKRFVFRKKKKLSNLYTKLQKINAELEQPSTFTYQEASFTRKEYLRRLTEAKNKSEFDFSKRTQLDEKIFEIEIDLLRVHRFDDRYYTLKAFQTFCEDLDIPMEEVLKIEDIVEEIEMIPHHL